MLIIKSFNRFVFFKTFVAEFLVFFIRFEVPKLRGKGLLKGCFIFIGLFTLVRFFIFIYSLSHVDL